MGLLDYINGFLEEVSTRRGRERQLGISPSKRDRALRERAVEEFKETNPDFNIRGDTQDFDGYVQYISKGKKYCEFIEGERNCLRAVDRYIEEYGYNSVHRELTARQLIPEIKDLFASYDQYFSKKVRDEKYLINIVLAQIWLDRLFSDAAEEKLNKKMIYEALLELISNREIPFYSIDELRTYGVYTELLAISKIMALRNVDLAFTGLQLTPVDDGVFDGFMADSYEYVSERLRVWRNYFQTRDGLSVNCEPYLDVDKWT